MTYNETLEFLYQQLPMFQRQGAAAYKANLNNTLDFCRYLGNPERHFPSVHVAGTNGKGSVSHFTASYLQESGLNVGLYTSPHLKDFRERIRVNGEMVTENFVVNFVEKHKEYILSLKPSFFEITFAMAIQYFSDREVDFAVMETGMGGRLDSTNVVDSKICVITNISMDHTQFLGDTLPKIAAEKAGIIKEHIPVVIGRRQAEVEDVFKAQASSMKAPIFFADDNIDILETKFTEMGLKLLVRDCVRIEKKLKLESPLAGVYQVNNLRTFLALASVMGQMSILEFDRKTIERSVKKVIVNTGMQGRWQTLSQKPLCIADTGHNEDGLKAVVSQLEGMTYKHLHIVLGMVNDKQIEHLLHMLPKDARYYFCRADIPRALPAEELRSEAVNAGLKGDAYASVADAYKHAMAAAQEDDMVFVGGSTFVVAEVLP